ncbi:MAG: hypothetical protein V3R56_04635 [Xanthomonadales bacterium]
MRKAVIVTTARTPIGKACRGVKYVVCTMCIGGGQGAASLFEVA